MATAKITYIDLFAGAGGLSEGFRRAGYEPIAHVEMDAAACNTLKTRNVYHWLKSNNELQTYYQYLNGTIDRNELYIRVPESVLNTVLNYEISSMNLNEIFVRIDSLSNDPVDLIIGGPPCQAYSLVGRSRDENGMARDPRNYLYRLYGRFLEHYRPKYFVFENVLGLLSAKNENGTPYLNVMKRLFRSKGYTVEYRVLSADEYGVPQKRKRIIIIGKRLKPGERVGASFYPAIPKLKTKTPRCSIAELFDDLPFLQAGTGSYRATKLRKKSHPYLFEIGIKTIGERDEVTFHIARPQTATDLEIYKTAVELWDYSGERLDYSTLPKRLLTHNNLASFLDRYKVVDGKSFFSHTVVAHIHKDGHYYIHPNLKQNRSLTPREAARLQTFPDNYYFESISGRPSRTSAYRQIGNAVPVLLAERIALGMRALYE